MTEFLFMSLSNLNRRTFLGAASALAVAPMALAQSVKRDFTPGANPVRYPDPDIIALDKRFEKLKIGNTPIQRLATGCLWAEGPAWNGVGNYLLWSDIPISFATKFIVVSHAPLDRDIVPDVGLHPLMCWKYSVPFNL